ncbi:MAG TPA: PDR/VanB family oxidoreductase [Variovorax sp.]|nr:PDR/VanB family oxidoreductase [Variovorax sp.]
MVERTLTVRVERIRRETPEILSFELAHPWGRELPGFEAGAHIDVKMPGGFSRQYSLAHAPDAPSAGGAGRYLIGVKREGASRGGSASMHERVREGDLLPISAPRNTFPVQADGQRHLLLAGGIGMTPLLAMAQHLAAQGADFELCVFARSREHLAFADALAKLGSRVRLHLDDGGAEHKIDLTALLQKHESGTHLYMCGPAGFMAAVRKAASHWPEDSVHAEYFAAPSDGSVPAGRAFSLRLTQRGFSVPVAADQSAVDALHDFGIDIPVSCEQGLCGTCVVPAEGEGAEHRDFCLTGSERQHKVALCCSRAREQELVIHL